MINNQFLVHFTFSFLLFSVSILILLLSSPSHFILQRRIKFHPTRTTFSAVMMSNQIGFQDGGRGSAVLLALWSIERRHIQRPWTTLTTDFNVTALFDADYLRNGTTDIHNFNLILIGTYTRPTQHCHFEW